MEKKSDSKTNWLYWAGGEALIGAVSVFILKMIGLKIEIIDQAIIMVLVISLVQVMISLIVARSRKEKLIPSRQDGFWLILMGAVVFLIDLLALVIFQLGGDVIIYSFIFCLSIIPGVLFDRYWFGKRFSQVQLIGIGVGVLAAYSMFGWPSFREVTLAKSVPLWIWLSILVSLGAAVIQGVSFKIKNTVSSMAMNVVGGSVVVILALLTLATRGSLTLLTSANPPYPLLWLLSFISGVLVVGQWVCNLTSYKNPNVFIAVKMLVVRGVFLLATALIGIIFFQEAFGIAQTIGVLLYLVAFILIKEEAWRFIRQLSKEKITM